MKYENFHSYRYFYLINTAEVSIRVFSNYKYQIRMLAWGYAYFLRNLSLNMLIKKECTVLRHRRCVFQIIEYFLLNSLPFTKPVFQIFQKSNKQGNWGTIKHILINYKTTALSTNFKWNNNFSDKIFTSNHMISSTNNES